MQTTRISYIPGDSHRLSILTQHEIEELYGLPRFTDEDRQTCFDLSEPERHAVHSRTTSVAVHLTLQLGYFKAKRQFFDYDQDAVRDDLLHILGRHFPGKNPATINLPSDATRPAAHRPGAGRLPALRQQLQGRTGTPRPAHRDALDAADLHPARNTSASEPAAHRRAHLYVPAGHGRSGRDRGEERKRTTQLLAAALTPDIARQLDGLLQADESAFRISVLKREPKDFSHKELRQEVERRRFFAPLHAFARHFLDATGNRGEAYHRLPSIDPVTKVREHEALAVIALDHHARLKKSPASPG
jgi:hypothetical protein